MAVNPASYGEETLAASSGRVGLAIVNHEHETATYLIQVAIDGEPAAVSFNEEIVEHIGPVILEHGEKWQQEIGLIPQHSGNNPRVDFILYEDGAPCFEEPLHLWIDVTS